jgi:hypothetical protein
MDSPAKAGSIKRSLELQCEAGHSIGFRSHFQ